MQEVEFRYCDSATVSDVTLYLRCIATFPHANGLPRDSVVNTWAFTAEDVVTREGAATDWTTAMNAFYGAVKTWLSSQYAWNSGTFEYLDLADDRPRVPFKTDSAALGSLSTANSDVSPELAVCLSFKGAPLSGANARRRRGRVYVGPLQLSGTDTWSPQNSMVDSIATAGAGLITPTSHTWCVYSRSTHYGKPVGEPINEGDAEVPDALPASFTPVTTVWVDNAFDTQRRRGVGATYRKTI